jgi:hypothetical protein
MQRRLCICVALVIAVSPFVTAKIGTSDFVPAATLLLPYFEVDLDNINGTTTLFTIVNADPSPALAHVTLWTNAAVPTANCDIYLTGFDVQAVNVRDFFSSEPPFDLHIHPDIGTLAGAHTGVEQPDEHCWSVGLGDNIARGYITMDSTVQFSTLFPGESGYFDDVASTTNQLMGDFQIADPTNNFDVGASMIHIEADANAFEDGDRTFYSSLVNNSAADYREPLSPYHATGYRIGGDELTEVIYWRDPGVMSSPFHCPEPDWAPLNASQVVLLDDHGNPASGAPTPPPYACGRLSVGSAELPTEYSSGWVYWNMNLPTVLTESQGAFIGVRGAEGRFMVAIPGAQL